MDENRKAMDEKARKAKEAKANINLPYSQQSGKAIYPFDKDGKPTPAKPIK